MSALFISDLHIDDTRPLVLAGLKRIAAEADGVDDLFILGDLVEVWVGDDDDGPTAVAVREALRTAAERCNVHVMHGNRDFLFSERFAAETGAAILEDPSIVRIDGEAVLVSHGDAYCTGDTAYQQARAMFRSPAWQGGVLAMTLAERRALAATLRAKSIAANENKADNIMDVTPSAIDAAMAEAGAATMVHGHTHRPAIHKLPGGRRRLVLGDWDRCGWKLELSRGEAALTCFALT